MKHNKYRLNGILMVVALALLSSQAGATEYTWTNNNAVWNVGGNWSPAGGPPAGGDTGIITNLICIANTNLIGGPTIEVRTNGSLYCGNGGQTFSNHTIKLNGGRWVLNSGTKGIVTSSDTVALESDSEMRAGINSDDQQWILSGLIRDGFDGGKGKLSINTTNLLSGNLKRGFVDITGTNNTYSGGTTIFGNFVTGSTAGNSPFAFSNGLVRALSPGALGQGDVQVLAGGYLGIATNNTTAAGKTITVADGGGVGLGIGGAGATFNCTGHNFRLQDGSLLRSGMAGTVNNRVNSYDAYALEGSAKFKNYTEGDFHIYGVITNGASAGKMVVQSSRLTPPSYYKYIFLWNPSNTFSGGLDIEAHGLVSIATNDAYGSGPITLLGTNSYLYLNQTPDADWTLANNLAGKGMITIEAGDGVKKLTCTGTVAPGTNGVAVTTNSTGILRVDGGMAFGAGSRLKIGVAGTNGVAGVDYDRLVVDHTLSGLSNAVLEIGGSTNLMKVTLTDQELVVVSNATTLAGEFASVQWTSPWRGKVKYNDPPGTVKLIEVTSASSHGSLLLVQ
jgi:hypothetical protein